MTVLVCGGRYYTEWDVFCNVMSRIPFKIDKIIEGGALGVDLMAREWADKNNIEWKEYPADWEKYGRAAGQIRNQKMIDEGNVDIVIAFFGNRGTEHMKKIAKKKVLKF